MNVREIEVVVISDLHLATRACKPKKILKYLKSIHTETLILNGDIIDSWRFSKNYFPKNHLKVIRQLIKMMEKGTQIYYVTGNHDEFLRKFNKTQIGKLKIVNQVILDLNGNKTWIFHGDIFDNIVNSSKPIAKFGSAVYAFLSLINNVVNHVLKFAGKSEIIIYRSFKKYFLKEKRSPSKFENIIAKTAVSQDYKTVICGHTHVPKEKELEIQGKKVHYINCGDWVEHFTASEYYNKRWHLFYFNEPEEELLPDEWEIPAEKQIFKTLLNELTYPNLL